MAEEVRISVRNLVEFILRSGDLTSGMGLADKEAMLKGSRLHRKLQKQMGGGYQAEVPLRHTEDYPDVRLTVEGRADGILEDEEGVLIDEIKGIYREVELLEGPYPLHRAQAMCYAHIYALQNHLSGIRVQVTYVNLETESIRRFQEELSAEELGVWFQKLVDAYHKWISYQLEWRQQRNASMKGLEFPFPYREGQRKITAGVYHTIARRKQLFVQAPTGVGKTMSAVFPAVRAVGEGLGEKIFYLTAKTITRTVAEEAFSILEERGLKYKVITLTAKEKLCFQEEAECDPEKCPYAKGHFDRVNDAVYELWTGEMRYDRETILRQADRWQVCPFEMSLDLAVWTDGVICDFNYVFDPNVHLKRFFGENVKGDYIFLVDEAHNLVDRGREMYSARLVKEDVLALRRRLKDVKGAGKVSRCLKKVNEAMLALKRDCETVQVLSSCASLLVPLMNLQGEMEAFLEDCREPALRKLLLDYYFTVRDFLNVAELVDENYVIYAELREDGTFCVKEYCVNPAANLKKYLDKGCGTVFFSATLLPLNYYKKLFSQESEVFMIYTESPFPRENRRILIGQDVSSRYTRRGREEYRRIAEYISRTAEEKEGNYMIFFPSYRVMQDVYEIFRDEFLKEERWRCLLQKNGMTEEEREAFLSEFSRTDGCLLGFCVMGGIFSEGIDLTGERLIGVVVVGTGLPQVTREREILKQFYDRRGESGFDYAYRIPGMTKVLQSAGRVIRTMTDRGVILLLDDRFSEWEYRRMFPVEWDPEVCRLGTVSGQLEQFHRSGDAFCSLRGQDADHDTGDDA